MSQEKERVYTKAMQEEAAVSDHAITQPHSGWWLLLQIGLVFLAVLGFMAAPFAAAAQAISHTRPPSK